MRWVLESDIEAFGARVGPLLEADIANNVVATVLAGAIDGQFPAAAPVLAVGENARGDVAAAALRTAPWPMLCTQLTPDDADGLLDLWLELDPELPGVNALLQTARSVSEAWTRRTGGSSRCRMAMAIHSLTTVHEPPHPAPGCLVRAAPGDRDLAVGWWNAFVEETNINDSGPAGRAAMVDTRLGRGQLWLWTHAGRPVSMVAHNPAVAGAVRIGPVYTPVEARRHGYASAAVAALSRHLLDAGALACTLFTDLANPTSNKIYADVGYRRCAEWEEHEFTLTRQT
jgi:uncharacterized protein